MGRDRTMERLAAEWWWPGMYTDVYRWCAKCEHCQRENKPSAINAWVRTELYLRPFRALQMDTVVCTMGEQSRGAGRLTGATRILTVICLFSRWVWLIPIVKSDAKTIARALLENVSWILRGSRRSYGRTTHRSSWLTSCVSSTRCSR